MPLALVLAIGGCDILDPIITTGVTSETGPWVTSTGTSDSATTLSDTSTVTTDDPGGTTDGATTLSDTSTVTTDSPDPSGAVFIVPPDDPPAQCDVWTQNCPAGEKCAAEGPPPVSSGSIACTPIVPDPAQLGEPCQVLVEGHLGPDTCDVGLYCLDVDPVTQQGTCHAICTGSPDNPVCGAGQVCLTSNEVPLCLEACDPLLETCPDDDVCIPLYPGFACWRDTDPPKGPLESCDLVNQCDDGLFCSTTQGAVECDPDGAGCCLAYCDLSAPGTCPGVGQECLPYFAPGDLPPGLEHVGACVLP
ncbi:hypothetical protein [Nannocystis exedens]|uniref:hypothetical protein n=1 Tax=Nannocystis exedens TaxID=54 RepID=UPI001160C6A1|nr:hypothetical protein [Nannocystis exedens]